MNRQTLWSGLCAAVFAVSCSTGKDKPDSDSKANNPSEPSADVAPKPPSPGPKETPVAEAPAPEAALKPDPGGHSGAHVWSKKIGGIDKDTVRGMAFDAQGNLALTGYFSSGAVFGDGAPVDAVEVDVYVSKYGPDGSHLWTKTFGGKGEDLGNSVAFDRDGAVLVVGLFTDTMMVGEARLTGQGSDDAFMAKFAADGTPVWARPLGGLDSDAAHDIVATPSGDLVVTGSFKGSMKAADVTLKSKGNEDIFVLKLDNEGNLVWITQYGDRYVDYGQSIALDAGGNILLLAEFTDEVSFGREALKSLGNRDLALVKLNPSGEPVWAKRYGSPFNELALGLAIDPTGNIVLTGSFDNEISFGGEKLKSQGESDIYVAKFNSSGEHLWSKSYGSRREDVGYDVAVDSYGNVIVGGWFWQSVDFGGGALEAMNNNKDAFLLKLSANGEHLWSKRVGSHDHDQIRGVAAAADGRIAAAGIFRFSVDLGGGALESARKPEDKAPPADVFVAVFER